jgi:hypothetical protein
MNASSVHFLLDADGCLTLPVNTAAVYLVLRLNDRGITVTVDGNDLVVTPRALLTDADRADLRRLKPHVRHVLAYTPPGVH